MWFLFGFITMFLFCSLSVWMRMAARWKGSKERLGNFAYLSKLVKHKGEATAYFIGVDAPDHVSFAFKRENWLDQIFKGIGFSSEHQIGRSNFDDAIYIVSDDEDLCRKLTVDKNIQADILDFFNTGSASCKAKVIRCHGGRLWVEYKTTGKAEEVLLSAIDTIAVPRLHKIANALSAVPRKAGRRWNDPFTLKAIAILSVSTGLAINFGVQMLRIYATAEVPFTVDSTGLWKMAALAGLAGAVVFFMAVTLLLGGSARAHLVLVEALLVGSLGVTGSAFVELRDLNIEWDTGNEVHHVARVVDKVTRKSRRSARRYYLVVEDWRAANARYEIKISRASYERVLKNDNLSIYEKPGYLAFPWVARLKNPYGAALE